MMKHLIYIFLAITFLCPKNLNSQGATSFYNVYSAGPFDRAEGVVQLPDSSYVITGSSSSFSTGTSQAFLFRIDSVGNRISTTSFGGDGSDIGRRVFYLPEEGFVVLGYSNSNPNGDGDFDIAYYRTDLDGGIIDTKYYGNSDWERLWDAKQLHDDGFILVGESEGPNSIGKDIFMLRLDLAGDTLWTKKIQTQGDDVSYDIVLLTDSTFATASVTQKDGVDHATLLAFHIDGSILWERTFDEFDGRGEFYAIDFYDNHFYVAGGFIREGRDDFDFWMLKVNILGQVIGQELSNYTDDDYFTHIDVKGFGQVYLNVESDSPDFNVFIGGMDLFFMCFHTDLYFVGPSQSFSGINDDRSNQLIRTNDGGYLFVGYVSDDRANLSLGSAILAVKVGPNDELTTQHSLNNPFLSIENSIMDGVAPIYPNPTDRIINLPSELVNENYSLYSIEGQLIQSGILESQLDLEGLSSGSYLLSVVTQNGAGVWRVYKR